MRQQLFDQQKTRRQLIGERVAELAMFFVVGSILAWLLAWIVGLYAAVVVNAVLRGWAIGVEIMGWLP